jgi:hypothetical protein
MGADIHLNIFRHPALPVPRGRETFDQAHDPAFRVRNDDVDEEQAPGQIRCAARRLDLAPGLPLFIWHSDTRRTRRAAALFADALLPDWTPLIMEVRELGEPHFELAALVTREQFEDPNRPSWLVRQAFLRAVIDDDQLAVDGGRAGIARRVQRLRARVDELGPINLLWVTHGLLMPFLHLSFVSGRKPESWTMEDVLATGSRGFYDYAEGFSHRLSVAGRERGNGGGHGGGSVAIDVPLAAPAEAVALPPAR